MKWYLKAAWVIINVTGRADHGQTDADPRWMTCAEVRCVTSNDSSQVWNIINPGSYHFHQCFVCEPSDQIFSAWCISLQLSAHWCRKCFLFLFSWSGQVRVTDSCFNHLHRKLLQEMAFYGQTRMEVHFRPPHQTFLIQLFKEWMRGEKLWLHCSV